MVGTTTFGLSSAVYKCLAGFDIHLYSPRFSMVFLVDVSIIKDELGEMTITSQASWSNCSRSPANCKAKPCCLAMANIAEKRPRTVINNRTMF
jgi:hypothetical protein